MAFDPITGLEAVVEAALSLAEQYLKNQVVKIVRENFTKARDNRLAILKEWSQGDKADLAKIAALEKEIQVYHQAIVDEIQLAKAAK